MKKYSIFVMSFLCMLLFQRETTAQSIFNASTALVDITPSNNGFPRMFLGGFGFRHNNPAQGTLTNQPLLTARALAIQDSSCTGNIKVIVTADILGFPHHLRLQILAEVLQRYGLANQNLLLAASHTHSGPVLTGSVDPPVTYTGLSEDGLADSDDLRIIDNYTNWFKDAIVNLIGAAIGGLSTAPQVTLSYGVGTVNFCVNRLGTPRVTDKDNDVPVLEVRSANDKSLLAVVFGYACHPLSVGRSSNYNEIFSYHPDYPGVARAQLEQDIGGMAFFIQGTAGDIDDPSRDGLIQVDIQGTQLAWAVESVLTGGGLQPVTGPILTESRDISLPLNMDPNDTAHQNLRAKYESIRNWPGISKYYVRHANQIIDQIDRGALPENEILPVQVWHFGATTPSSLVLTALGGEPVSHYSLFLKDQFRTQLGNKLWVAGYCNEVPGYIPSNLVWDLPLGGVGSQYEAGWGCGTDFCDPLISSFGVSQMWYGWPAPLKRGNTDTGGTVKGMEELVKENTTRMIEYLPGKGYYVFKGFQKPLDTGSSRIFKAGTAIPVKFILTDCNGQSISTAKVTIAVNKITDAVLGAELELNVVSYGKANTGNLFRYDDIEGQYIFDLNTKSYSTGTYKVYAKPDNGQSYSVNFSLK